MRIRRSADIAASEITDPQLYRERRAFLAGTAGLIGAALLSETADAATAFPNLRKSSFNTTEPLSSRADITTYNNFYEFGTDKSDPARNAHTLVTRPWTVQIDGEVKRAQTVDVDTLLRWSPPEERIYRMRCVEAWSMVIPWVGLPLAAIIKRAEPTSRAKYVEFTTLHDPKQMPGQRSSVLQWPYVEGLRMDEAVHPLTILAVGLYGDTLPNQNGAPLRLVVPWKYGFKGVKSIVRIRFTEQAPLTSWRLAPSPSCASFLQKQAALSSPTRGEGKVSQISQRP